MREPHNVQNRPVSLETAAVHAGREDLRQLGVHAPPLDLSTTYPVADLAAARDSIDALAAGEEPGGSPIYARLHNPTVARFESALARLEGAGGAVAFASGMAALTAALLATRVRGGGGHVVAVRPLYGGSDHLLASALLGFDVGWATPDTVAQALRPHSALVIVETPANPTLQLCDIAAVVRQAGDVPVLVDSTFATPVLQRPLDHGAAMVLHSATKFLGGHGDIVGGAIAAASPWLEALRQVRVATGAILHPLAGYLLHRGLQTLPARVRMAQDTAGALARRLLAHPEVARVHYPSLDRRNRALLERQMRGPGALIAFELRGGAAAATRAMRRLRLITPAVSLGSIDSLIQHPASLTHRLVDERARARHGISPGLLRLSVGLEDADDLWADLEDALHPARDLAERGTSPGDVARVHVGHGTGVS